MTTPATIVPALLEPFAMTDLSDPERETVAASEGVGVSDRILFGVDMASDRGTVVVCGSAHTDEMRLVQERLRDAGHTIVHAEDLDRRGDLIERMREREYREIVVCEPPPRLSYCFRDPDFKPLRNRMLPRRVLKPTTTDDHAAIAAAQERQARKAHRRAALALATSGDRP